MQKRNSMEPCNRPETLSSDRKRAIEELIRGREFTTQLQAIIQRAPADDDDHGTNTTTTSSSSSSSSKSAEDLVSKILESLNGTISMLMTSTETDEVSQELAGSYDGRKSEDSSESCKTPAFKDRRGCYKRRRTSDIWKTETSTLIDDGHSWRKYGQKVILNAKHPRNYYRCTHKYDQSCQATKQVQKIEDDPPKFLTTYYGRHTCKNLLKAPQIIIDSTDHDSSILLSFASNNNQTSNKRSSCGGPCPSSFPSSVKQEIKEEFESFCHSNLSDDYYLPGELTGFETTCEAMAATLSSSGSDRGDVISSGVYSCTPSPHSLEMDMMVVPVDFDDVLQFEF